jgi:pyruvate,water dikinase
MDAFPDADYPGLVSGLPNLAHLEPVDFIRNMANRGQLDATEFVQRFAHRSRHELDIRTPRWDEDPDWVEHLLRASAPRVPLSDPRQTYDAARKNALAKLPPRQRARFQRKLDRLRTFVWLREEMRDLSTRVYHLLRRCVLAIAHQRGLGDDIFFMRWQDILADDRQGIDSGRATYEGYRHFRAPNEIGARYPFLPHSPSDIRHSTFQGLPASPGRVTAPARVARCVEDAIQVEPGCVLVCPFTDPGWTPVLGRVAGVITETGGLLSHAAVICREFGIPAVLSVPDATRRIRDGIRLSLDGGTGSVKLAD